MPIDNVKNATARAAAVQIMSDLALEHPCDMELEDIAWARGVLVKEEDLTGADGRLVKIGEKGIISVKKGIPEKGRKRFTIAHELGHFELHKSVDQLDICNQAELVFDYKHINPEEQEANTFAAELLLPTDLFRKRCQNMKPSFETIRHLAEEFQTTVSFAAIRFVQFTPHQVALVATEKQQVKWYRASENFGYRIEVDIPINSRTCAAYFFTKGKAVSDSVEAIGWLKDRRIDPSAYLQEECFPLARYETVLSLLWIEKSIELDSDYG